MAWLERQLTAKSGSSLDEKNPAHDRELSDSQGVHQISEMWVRSWTVIGTSSGMVIPKLLSVP